VTTTYNIACGGLYGTSTASVNVTVVPVTPVVTPPTSGGGGGGTAPRSGTRHGISTSQVLGESLSCDYLKDYLRIGWSNDRTEVIKLQIFLRELEGFKNLSITGVFDIDTFNAVSTFQERYPEAILTPWGYKVNEPTGFVYILTKKKVNEIVCQRAFPLNTLQETEIQEFKSFLESLKSKGVIVPELQTVQVTRPVTLTNTPVSTTTVGSNHLDLKPLTGVSNEKIEDNTKVTKNGFFSRIAGLFSNNAVNREAAGAVFAGPQGWEESLNSIVVFFTILLGLYLIVTTIVERQMKKRSLTLDSQKIRKMFIFILGLLVSAVIAFAVRFYSIVLPLVVLMIILSVSLLWFTLKPKEVRTIITIDKP
jgi:hypothetical protein